MTEAQIKADETREFAPANTRNISGCGDKASEHEPGVSNPVSSVAKKKPKKIPDGGSKQTIVIKTTKAGTRAQARSLEQRIVDSVEKTIQEESILPHEIDSEKLFNLLKQVFGRTKVSPHGCGSYTNYQNKTADELRRLLTERNVAFDSKLKKSQLEQALIDNDHEENSPSKTGKRRVRIASEGQESQIYVDQPLVHPETGKSYDARFEHIDPTKNFNKQYCILALESKEHGSPITKASWGRIGGQTKSHITCHGSQLEAITYFNRKCKEKLKKGYCVPKPRCLPKGGVDLSGASDQTFNRQTDEIRFQSPPQSPIEGFSNENCFQTKHSLTPPEEVSSNHNEVNPSVEKSSWLNWMASK